MYDLGLCELRGSDLPSYGRYVIDYESEYTVYEQIARYIRQRIERGEWGPRRRLPTVAALAEEYGVAKDTVQQAIGYLRDLGIVYTVKKRGSYVKVGSDLVTVVVVEPGMRVIYRAADDVECAEMGLTEGASVAVIERAEGAVEVLPADKVELRGPEV